MALDQQRIADISQALYGAVLQADDAYETLDTLKTQKSEATGELGSKREYVLGAVAKLSSAGAWSNLEILAAAKAASEMYQGGDKAKKSHVQTLVNHAKLAAHPLVRDQYTTLHGLVVDTLEMEALDPDADKPVMKCFKRRYHAIVGVLRVVSEGVHPMTCAEDLIEYAEANDPDFSAKNAAKKLAALVSQLNTFNKHFPMRALAQAAVDLASIDADTMQAARNNLLMTRSPSQNTPQASATVAAQPKAVKPNDPTRRPATAHPFAPKAAPTPAPATVIAETLNDALDDLTGGVDLAEAAD